MRHTALTMQARTRNTLIGLGFDTDLIELIAKNNHTVDVLRSLSTAALKDKYSDEHVALIQAKIKRQPIPEETVTRVLAAAGGVCCYCEDGVATRPYQIHHIHPYAATQDHSEENLLVVCPTHHVVIHQVRIPAFSQRLARRKWQTLVSLADRYRGTGLSFPFGSFVAVDYDGQPSASELVREIRVAPPTALAVSKHSLALEVKQIVLRDGFALLLGRSGDGKSTLAVGVSGLLRHDGWMVFRYRPPDRDNRHALKEILEFIAVAARECVLILDDVNTYMSATDLEDVAAATSGKAAVIATWTRETGGEDTRVELHLPKWVSTDWPAISTHVISFLAAHEPEVVREVQAIEGNKSVWRVGLGMFEDNLIDRMKRYEQEANTTALLGINRIA